jgi:hypothetical protein
MELVTAVYCSLICRHVLYWRLPSRARVDMSDMLKGRQ